MALSFDLSLLSKYRTPLMGIAMLFVMFFHLPIDDSQIPFVFRFIRRIGFGGVDFFFFLSGLGIYFAYTKNSTKQFYNKRLLRILPYYIPIVIAFSLLFQYPNGIISFKDMLLQVFLLDFWAGKNALGWYIPVAILFYIITPALMNLVSKNIIKYSLILISILVVTDIVICIFLKSPFFMYIFIRLADYMLGVLIGYLISQKRRINYVWLLLSLIVGISTLLLNYIYSYQGGYIALLLRVLPFFFLALPMCSLISYLFSLVRDYKYPVLSFVGTYTLCIYAFQERINEILLFYHVPYVAILGVLLTFPLAVLWQTLVSKILTKVNHLS